MTSTKIIEAVRAIADVYTATINGGNLRCVLELCCVDDDDLAYCEDQISRKSGPAAEIRCLEILRCLTPQERLDTIALYRGDSTMFDSA